ncbi:hypothetical protein NKR19_g8783 [Coniochaeta hoffmannii]|uniref:Uncharacterized protein n=1 Tax=Coniochaeta hoffmannii TaxID=91930 RepID=A0AA38VBY5_9PEZI|nr:hypothetical protein NKR19_g8783 [Coniochaeta hoffmannii]
MANPDKTTKMKADKKARKARKSRNRAKAKKRFDFNKKEEANNKDETSNKDEDTAKTNNPFNFKISAHRESKTSQRWRERKHKKEAKIKAGTWKEFKIELSESETTVPDRTYIPEYSTLPLSWAIPQPGFLYPHHSQVTSRPGRDMSIKTAMYEAGVPLERSSVVPLLAKTKEMAAISCYAVYATEPDDTHWTALNGAIDACKRGTEWASGVPLAVFTDLLLSIRAARRMHLKVTGFDDTEPNSWARTLAVAVDEFDEAVQHRGWWTIPEFLAMEAADDDNDDDDDVYTNDINEAFGGIDINRAQDAEEDQRTEKGQTPDK